MTFGVGMNSGFGMQQMNQGSVSMRRTGTIMQNLKDKYGCEDCFQHGPYFAHYPIPVQEVPKQVIRPSFISKIMYAIFGG